jgi:glutathione S-transferase
MLSLHYYPSTAAMIPHIVLEEIGADYERVFVDRTTGEHRKADYLRLNPNGLLPVLRDGDLTLYETAAIVLHLCDTHPAANLAPSVGSAARAEFYKWLMWLTNTLQTALIVYFYPDRWVEAGNEAGAGEIKRVAERKVAGMLTQLDEHLGAHGQEWFAGASFTALDPYVFTLCRWTRNFANERPARDYEHLGPYLRRVLARPAVQRVISNEGLGAPFI